MFIGFIPQMERIVTCSARLANWSPSAMPATRWLNIEGNECE